MSLHSQSVFSKRTCPTMASEYSILTDVAAALGTYRLTRETQISNHNAEAKALPRPIYTCGHTTRTVGVHAEAELLLNLMARCPDGVFDATEFQKSMPGPEYSTSTSYTTGVDTASTRPSIISPSFSFEAKRDVTVSEKQGGTIADTNHTYAGKCTMEVSTVDSCSTSSSAGDEKPCFSTTRNSFSLSCPCLSLHQDHSSIFGKAPKDSATPSYLFSRPIHSETVDVYAMDMSSIASSIATNLVDSFKTAMKWRTKVWIQALTRALSVQYQSEVNRLTKTFSCNHHSLPKFSVDSIKEEIKKSHEARVIGAISKAASHIVVHDVRTTFFVLEQKLNAENVPQSDDGGLGYYEKPPLKRLRLISKESVEGSSERKMSQPYDLTHAITLDAKCSISTSSSNKMTVALRAPGVIHGTFIRDNEGNVFPQSVVVTLDTEALAMAMEENSRHVMRTASEEWMVSPPANYCTIYDTVQESQTSITAELDKVSSCDTSDSIPEPQEEPDSLPCNIERGSESYMNSPTTEPVIPYALITPTVTNGMYERTSTPYKMPLPPRSLPLEDECTKAVMRSAFLNPRRVSPSQHSTTFDSPTPNKPTAAHASKVLTSAGRNYLMPPSLVSPYTHQSGEEMSDDSDAPTMPALLEVACAGQAKCH